MQCCPQCIGDQFLTAEVFPTLSAIAGECSYCGATGQRLLDPVALQEEFEFLVGIYFEDAGGRSLGERLREDWSILENARISEGVATRLLCDIFGDEGIGNKLFSLRESAQSDAILEWERFRTELKYRNRFFPRSGLNLDRLRELLPYLSLKIQAVAEEWCRARVQRDNRVLAPEEMGAPPEKLTRHGRANPAGIPYLYLASDRQTAVSEIRPHTGERVSLAQFHVQDAVRIVDLRRPRKSISPFLLARDDVKLNVGNISFLERLGEELTRPVLRQSAAIDYTPTQYLCEFIKECGFDGVTYRSALSDGVNLALFRPDKAESGRIMSMQIEKVTVESFSIN